MLRGSFVEGFMDPGNILVMVLIAGTLVLLIAGEIHCRRNAKRNENAVSLNEPLASAPQSKDVDTKVQQKQVA